MDIKKPDFSIQNSSPTSVTKQLGESNNQTQQQNLLNNKGGAITNIKIGQQIELIVLKLTDYEAIMEIAGSKTQVRTSDKELLQLGQHLKAEIISIKPMIQLKVLSTEGNQDNKIQSLINSALREIAPSQQPIKNLLENIQLITKTNLPKNSPLLEIKENFIRSIPPSQAFETAEILPEILKRSGLFTEHVLQNLIHYSNKKDNFPNNDLKISLLRLATKLRNIKSDNMTLPVKSNPTSTQELYSPSTIKQNQKEILDGVTNNTAKIQNNAAIIKVPPPVLTQEQIVEKLLSHTEGALAKLQVLQLQHLQPSDSQKTMWSFELPIRTDNTLDNIMIYIEEDAEGENSSQYTIPWKVILKFNIKELGSIQAHISLQGTKVSVNFWIENKSTTSLFSKNLSLLDSQLKKVGLESGKINCHCDTPPKQVNPQPNQFLNETS